MSIRASMLLLLVLALPGCDSRPAISPYGVIQLEGNTRFSDLGPYPAIRDRVEITVYTPRCQSLQVDGKEYDVGWSLPGSPALALTVTFPKAGPAYRLKVGDREVVITLADGKYVHIYDDEDGFLIGQSNAERRYYPVSP